MSNLVKYLLVIFLVMLYPAYKYVKHTGYIEAETKYVKILKDNALVQDTLVKSAEATIQQTVKATKVYNTKLAKDIKIITEPLETVPLIIYKDQACELTEEFVLARSQAINRANQR